MVVLQHIAASDGVAAGRGYSEVVTGRGRLVVVSGQVAQDESGELVGPGDPAAQARQVFENLRRCLAQVGAGFGDVVKLTFFVLNVADLAFSASRPGWAVAASETWTRGSLRLHLIRAWPQVVTPKGRSGASWSGLGCRRTSCPSPSGRMSSTPRPSSSASGKIVCSTSRWTGL